MAKKIISLTGGLSPVFTWRLPREVAAYKQPRLPAGQWINVIKGLSSKGIKLAEIEDSKVLGWLEEQGKQQLMREEVAEYISYALPNIKEVQLSGRDAQYKKYSWSEEGGDYNESIFYFPQVAEDFSDRIADLDESIAQLNFDFDRLGEDPDLVFRLDAKRMELLGKQKDIIVGRVTAATPPTHFGVKLSEICPDARADFAHMRWSVMMLNGTRTLLIHEVQSDWAQKGREAEWRGAYKRAPLVTETEYWTTFLLRRAIALAIESGCGQMTWINGASMANGGQVRGAAGLDEFYMKIVPSAAKKLAKPFSSELHLAEFSLLGKMNALAVMPVTKEMRERFMPATPVYSYANLVAGASFDPIKAEKLRRALQMRSDRMFGQNESMRVCVVREVLQACEERRPVAALVGRAAQVAFSAEDPVMAYDHEAFHFAARYHFNSKEREVVRRQFQAGAPLHVRTVRLLVARGDLEAARQAAADPEEAAAHAFSLWRKGQMALSRVQAAADSDKSRGLIAQVIDKFFPRAEMFVASVCHWIRGTSVSPTDFVARIVRIHGEEPAVLPPKREHVNRPEPEEDEHVHLTL